MPNYNIKIDLLKLKGAKTMDIQGRTEKRRCIVIPINNEEGTIQDAYKTMDKPTGLDTYKSLNSCYLNLTAFEMEQSRYGQSHFIKAAFERSMYERMTEEQKRQLPFIGNMKPWEPVPVSAPVVQEEDAEGADW